MPDGDRASYRESSVTPAKISRSWKWVTVALVALAGTFSYAAGVPIPAGEYTGPLDETSAMELLDPASRRQSAELLDSLSRAQQFLTEVEARVIRFPAGCGTEFLSDDGYAVTALHCLDATLRESLLTYDEVNDPGLLMDKVIGNYKGIDGKTWPIVVRGPVADIEHRTDRILEGIGEPAGAGRMPQVSVVLAGQGYPDFKRIVDPALLANPRALRAIRRSMDDFAIVKFSRLPKGASCSRITEKLPRPGDTVWVTGFPAAASRPESFPGAGLLANSLPLIHNPCKSKEAAELISQLEKLYSVLRADAGEDQLAEQQVDDTQPMFISTGHIYRDYEELRKFFPYPMSGTDTLDAITDPSRYFVSTAPISEGFSGGAAFTPQGELAGINSMGPISLLRFGKAGTSPLASHVSMKHVAEEARKRLGQEAAARIFHCSSPETRR